MEREDRITELINRHINTHGSVSMEYVTILAMLIDDQIENTYNEIFNIK